MPSPVRELFSSYGLKPAGCVRWGQPVREPETGVYVIAVSGDVDDFTETLPTCPLNPAALKELVRVCPRLLLDGAPTTATAVGERIASFWIADEVAIYIGRAGQPAGRRISQYYRTPIGAPKPHKGGWWIKTLRVLPQLWVHWARTSKDVDAEDAMLDHFAAHLSPAARAALPAGPLIPFANLVHGDHRRKIHGIRNATAREPMRITPPPRTVPAASQMAATGAPVTARSRPATATTASAASATATTQRMTAADRASGRIRFPRASKHLLPGDRADVTVRIDGHELVCRWDPRYGPPERSGVLAVGRAFAAEHLTQSEMFDVSIAGNVVVLS